MKLWAWLLVLIAAAVAAAFGWHWLADDPGYLLLRLRGTTIETTLVFALLMLVVAWVLAALLWRLVRWPLRGWQHRVQKKSRERLARGLTALTEGRYVHAEKELLKATHYAELRAPALLAAARAALAQGEVERVDAALNEASEAAPAAALAMRARLLREQGRLTDVYALLKPAAQIGSLPPAAWNEYIEAALVAGDAEAARVALAALGKTQSLPPDRFAALEGRVLAAAFATQRSADAANALWASLTRAQRRVPETLAAYARRVAILGQPLPGMSEIEAGLRKEWNDTLVQAYGDLGPADAAARMRTAEGWLPAHPNSAPLLTTLGRLCVQCELWGKARDYLQRALGVAESALAWQSLGDAFSGENEAASAARCYRNALKMASGDATEAIPQRGPRLSLNTKASVVEERSEHGVPRLPGA